MSPTVARGTTVAAATSAAEAINELIKIRQSHLAKEEWTE